MGRQCPECSRDFEDGDTLFDHLLDQHGYSMDYAEDTVIGTDPDLNTPSYSKESMEDEAGVWWDSLSISDRENLIGGGAQSDSWDLDKQLSWSELQTRPNYDPSQSFFDSSTTVNDILTTYVSGFYKAQGLDDAQWDETGGDWDGNMRPDWSDTGGQSNTWFGSVLNPTLTTRSGNTLNYESKASESANTKEDIEAVMNVHGDDWTDEEIIQQVAKMGAYPLGSTPHRLQVNATPDG